MFSKLMSWPIKPMRAAHHCQKGCSVTATMLGLMPFIPGYCVLKYHLVFQLPEQNLLVLKA